MRIGTNIGIMSSIMDAALESLNYKYTWAASFHDATGGSLANATDLNGFTTNPPGMTARGLEYVVDGLKLSYDGGGSAVSASFTFNENVFPLNQTSSGGGSSGTIPAGLIPDLAGDAATPHAEFIGHPSRYFSIVVTVTDMNLTDGEVTTAAHRGLPFGFDMLAPGPDDGERGGRLRNIASLGGYFSHINGVENGGISDASTKLNQTNIDDRIATGSTIAFTYDLSESDADHDPNYQNPSDNISQIAIYPFNYNPVDLIEFTMHGFIFSDVPPIIKKLPVETQTATPNY